MPQCRDVVCGHKAHIESMDIRQMNRANETLEQSIKLEHYRLHCVERWADSPYKEAVLAAAHSVLESLEASLEPHEPPACMVCATRRTLAPVLMFRSKPKGSPAGLQPAA
jgi:hypothetical protein